MAKDVSVPATTVKLGNAEWIKLAGVIILPMLGFASWLFTMRADVNANTRSITEGRELQAATDRRQDTTLTKHGDMLLDAAKTLERLSERSERQN